MLNDKIQKLKERERLKESIQHHRFTSATTLPGHCSMFYKCSHSIALYLCLEFQTP